MLNTEFQNRAPKIVDRQLRKKLKSDTCITTNLLPNMAYLLNRIIVSTHR